MTIIDRALSVPLNSRFYQFTNWLIEFSIGRQMRLIHLVEYPRCGGTWLRHLVQTYTGAGQYVNNRFLTPGTVIQLHRLPRRSMHRVIVLVRDPRDMYVSQYHKLLYHDSGNPLIDRMKRAFEHQPHDSDDFHRFLRHQLTSPIHPTFTYRRFVGEWLSRPNTCLIRYEDCHRDTAAELTKVLRFLGEEIVETKVTASVELNSFENRTRKRSGVTRKKGEEAKGQFERKGIVGDWQNHFTRESAELLEEFDGEILRKLGYEKASSWCEHVPKHLEQVVG